MTLENLILGLFLFLLSGYACIDVGRYEPPMEIAKGDMR